MKKPTVDDQKRLIEIDNQKYEVVNIPRTNKKVKVGWMKPHTFECVSKLMLDSGFEDNREYRLISLSFTGTYSLLSSTVLKLTYFIIYIGGGYIT